MIYDYLRTDPVLVGTLAAGQYTGILTGGIWDRPLKREGASHTPEAFYQSEIGKMNRPAGVILDGGMSPHRQVEAIPHAYWSFPRVILYAPASRNGKIAIESAFGRIYDLLHEWWVQTDELSYADVRFADRTGIIDNEEFIGAVSATVRFQVTSRYRTGE